MIKFLTPNECVKLAYKKFNLLGFIKGGQSENSFYVYKNNGRKIRISDHVHNSPSADVIYQLVFNDKTIEPDVEYQVKKAIQFYDRKIQNMKNKRNSK